MRSSSLTTFELIQITLFTITIDIIIIYYINLTEFINFNVFIESYSFSFATFIPYHTTLKHHSWT